MKRSAFDESRDQRIADETPKVRTDYSCKAHGCPNAGSMERSLCYYHWNEPEAYRWDEVTQRIRENFDVMRNHGQFSPELQAKHKADSMKRFGALHRKPTGLVIA